MLIMLMHMQTVMLVMLVVNVMLGLANVAPLFPIIMHTHAHATLAPWEAMGTLVPDITVYIFW